MSAPRELSDLNARRCFIHAERAASVRCPGCAKFYCRECVIDHDEMMLCQSCIAQTQKKPKTKKHRLRYIGKAASLIVSSAIVCSVFYLLGHLISKVPESFHDSPSEYLLEESIDE